MCMYTCVCIYFRIYFCLYISLYVRNIYNIYISTYIITSFPSLLTCLSVCHYIRFILISGSHYFSITSYATSESPFPPQNLFNSIISHFPAFISSSCLFSFFLLQGNAHCPSAALPHVTTATYGLTLLTYLLHA